VTGAMSGSILVIEDNKDLALGLRVNLEEEGYQVSVAHSLADGLAKLRQLRPDLLLLDLSLPDGDGLDLLRRLRAAGDSTLILVLTAKTHQDTKLVGLRGGGDDYVTKPFDLEELLARVEVLLRRRRPLAPQSPPPTTGDESIITFANIEVDPRARVVRRNGEAVQVSRMGFDLLLVLLRHRGAVVTRGELMRDVWGYPDDVNSRTLDTHIFELRKLIEPNPSAPVHIRTVWRIGYRLE
jgi:two-component system, OmpR family, alkaline phosphatase synthesis response regulator PhoP